MNYLPYWVMFFVFFLLNIYCVIDVFRHDFKYPPFATLYLFLLVCVAFRLLASLAYFHPLLCQNWHCWPWIWPSVSVWELKFLSVHSWMLRCVCVYAFLFVCMSLGTHDGSVLWLWVLLFYHLAPIICALFSLCLWLSPSTQSSKLFTVIGKLHNVVS